MKSIQSVEDYVTLVNQSSAIVLDFYADWCGPCKSLLPTVEKLSEEYVGKVEIQKVNVDQNKDLADQFGVRSIPALFFIKNGNIVDQSVGVLPVGELKDKIESLI